MDIKGQQLTLADGVKFLQNKWAIEFLTPDPEDTDEGIFQLNGETLKTLNSHKVIPVSKLSYQGCQFYATPPIEPDGRYKKEYMIVYFERGGEIHVITTYRDEHQNTWVVPTYADCGDEEADPVLGTGYETQETMTWPVPVQIFLMHVYANFKMISVNQEPTVFEAGIFKGDETPAIFWNEEAENEELVIELGQFKQRDEGNGISYQFVAGMEPDTTRIEHVGTSLHKALNREVGLYYMPSSDDTVDYLVEYDANLRQAAFASIQPAINIARDYTPFGLNGKTFTRKSLMSFDATGTLVDKLILALILPADKLPLGYAKENSDKLTYTQEYLCKIRTLEVVTKKVQDHRAKAQELEAAAKATATTAPVQIQTVSNTAPAPQMATQDTPQVLPQAPSLSPIQKLVLNYQDIHLLKEDIEKSGPQHKGFAYNLFKSVENTEELGDDLLIDFMTRVFKLIEIENDVAKANYCQGLFYFVLLFNRENNANTKLTRFSEKMQHHELLKDISPLKGLSELADYIKSAPNLHQGLKLTLQRLCQEQVLKL